MCVRETFCFLCKGGTENKVLLDFWEEELAGVSGVVKKLASLEKMSIQKECLKFIKKPMVFIEKILLKTL